MSSFNSATALQAPNTERPRHHTFRRVGWVHCPHSNCSRVGRGLTRTACEGGGSGGGANVYEQPKVGHLLSTHDAGIVALQTAQLTEWQADKTSSARCSSVACRLPSMSGLVRKLSDNQVRWRSRVFARPFHPSVPSEVEGLASAAETLSPSAVTLRRIARPRLVMRPIISPTLPCTVAACDVCSLITVSSRRGLGVVPRVVAADAGHHSGHQRDGHAAGDHQRHDGRAVRGAADGVSACADQHHCGRVRCAVLRALGRGHDAGRRLHRHVQWWLRAERAADRCERPHTQGVAPDLPLSTTTSAESARENEPFSLVGFNSRVALCFIA
jgi:hypothetical protein